MAPLYFECESRIFVLKQVRAFILKVMGMAHETWSSLIDACFCQVCEDERHR